MTKKKKQAKPNHKKKIEVRVKPDDKPIKNPNSYVGRTYRISDNDLPHTNADSNKTVNLAVIEENGKFIAGVRTTGENTRNTQPFVPKHNLYKGYKTFLEIEFNNGKPLSIDSPKMHENPWNNNLSAKQVSNVRKTLYTRSRQINQNIKNRDKLKKRRS